jgi:hypothetical protein
MSSHTCESRIEGGWIVFYCPDCGEDVRRLNLATQKTERLGGDDDYNHQGSFSASPEKWEVLFAGEQKLRPDNTHNTN